MINTRHRIMAKSPIYLTHESIHYFFNRLGEDPPWTVLLTQQHRIRQSLKERRDHLVFTAMANETPDVCIHVPDLWICELTPPTDVVDPPPTTQAITCREYHRTFKQAGILKRYLRIVHAIPHETEDICQPLRDVW